MLKSTIDWIAYILVVIGALNWGFFAFGINLVPILSLGYVWLATTIYVLIGLSGLWVLYKMFK